MGSTGRWLAWWFSLGLLVSAAAAQTTPWRIGAAAGAPSWLRVGLSQRTRYEYLWNQFRSGAPGDDRALSLLTLVQAEARVSPLVFGVELQDARVYFDDANAPLDTTLINAVELLQAYAGADLADLFQPGATGRLRAGRLTMDLGSRRLVARNLFRNTINAFTGIDAEWTSARRDGLRVFATLPVQRLPSSRAALDDNGITFDEESFDTVFWGVFAVSRPWWQDLRGEAYVYGLHEDDAADLPTRDRELYTPGFRLYRKPARGALDLEIETAVQAGTSRATARADDVDDLDHLAFLVHLGVGATLAAPWDPRLALLYDYASGDADPDDGDNERFDTLFGARRFEYGPTGIYGAFARSNVHGPGLRIDSRPHPAVDANFQYRPFWLAEKRDAWVTSGLRDASGAAGDFLGNQIEARVLWRVLPGNLSLEVGFAHLWLGGFPESAPDANAGGDPTYVYTQMEVLL